MLNSTTTATSSNTNNAIVCQDLGGKCTVTEVYGDIDTASTPLNIGTINANTVNIATRSTAQVFNVETSCETTTINLESAGDTVNVVGTLTYVNTSNQETINNIITINEGGETGSARVKKGAPVTARESSV